MLASFVKRLISPIDLIEKMARAGWDTKEESPFDVEHTDIFKSKDSFPMALDILAQELTT